MGRFRIVQLLAFDGCRSGLRAGTALAYNFAGVMPDNAHAADRGKVIGGRYELVEIAGEGGMAAVWRGVIRGAAGFARPVAIKKMRSQFRAMRNYIDMFVEEARVGAELMHPNIVQVYDFCQDDDGSFYLIMEWIDGIDLGSFALAFAHVDQPVPWPLVAAIGVDSIRGLAAAHERRGAGGQPAPVIHRDVSPHNVLVGVNGISKLTDFGLARAKDRVQSLTAPGMVKGKLSYLAPEQTTGADASPQSDIFTLGAALWESLVGRPLFRGDTDIEVFSQIRRGQITPIRRERPDMPEQLAEVIDCALAFDPSHRFASAREFGHALNLVLGQVQTLTEAHYLVSRAAVQARQWLGLRGAQSHPMP
jgi:eukaryotic-like serine/threonine-protein kinase